MEATKQFAARSGSVHNQLAIAPTPNEMYQRAFEYFAGFFRPHGAQDVSTVNLLAFDLPETIREDRRIMGAVMTAGVIAILDHETQCGIQGDVPTELHQQLDEIILKQCGITGNALLTSDLVLSRASEWERTDYRRYRLWLKALEKAARIHQQRTPAPIDTVFLPAVKKLAIEELRPVVARIRERFARQHRTPSEQEIVEAFAKETHNPDLPFLSHKHNRKLWLRFYQSDPVAYLNFSPERLFDAFTAFVTTHEPEYVRKKISAS